jgi:hypothetical protein
MIDIRTLLALCLCATAPTAQTESAGLFMGTPISIVAGSGTGTGGPSLDTHRLHSKPAGFQAFTPVGAPTISGSPEFSLEAILGGPVPAALQINAFSAGMDVLPVDPPTVPGEPAMVNLGTPSLDPWGVLGFSVSRETDGAFGSLIAGEAAAPGGAGADLFTYILPGSVFPSDVADCYPVNQTQRAVDGAEMGLSGPGVEGEVEALDIFIPAWEVGAPVDSDLPEEPSVYFSLSHESFVAGVVPDAWFDPPLGLIEKSPGTILKSTWDSALGTWSTPQIFLTRFDLGLQIHDDVDALAVDEINCLVLFSIRVDASYPPPLPPVSKQLQVARFCSDFAGGLLVGDLCATDSTGTSSVAERTGLSDPDDDIDGLCTEDPANQLVSVDRLFAVPTGALKPNRKTFSASMFRDRLTGGPTITLVVEGLPTVGPSRSFGLLVQFPDLGIALEPIYVMPVGAGAPSSSVELSLVDASLAALDEEMIVIPLVGGGGLPLECAATLSIQL